MDRIAMDRFRGRLITQVNGPRMLERARGKPLPAAVTLHLMDVEELRFPPGSFDSVAATCVFCSVPDPVRGLSEIRRVLRPDGRALFLEHMRPGAPWLATLSDWLDPLVSRAGPHINRRTMDNIKAAGFAVEREDNLLSDVLKLVVAHP